MTDSERELILGFLRKCRDTHVKWVNFLESGVEYVPMKEDVGDVTHHRECIEGYDKMLTILERLR